MIGTRRIRDLHRPYGAVEISSWPPRWVPSYDGADAVATSEDGVLTWVERMPNGPGLWLTMRIDGIARRGPLLWSGEPSVAELERILREQIGRTVRHVGHVEIVSEPMLERVGLVATRTRP